MNRLEIKSLIDHYRSEQAKLKFQMDQVKATIKELRELQKTAPEAPQPVVEVPAVSVVAEPAPKKAPAKKKRGRKKTTAQKPGKKRGPGRPKKKVIPPNPDEPTGPGDPAPTLKKRAAKKAAASKKQEVKEHQGTKSPSKRGRKKGAKAAGYKLNEWDQALINAIENKGKVMVNSEMIEVFQKLNDSMNVGLTESDLKSKLNRTLTKLANRRDVLAKTSYSGKGFAYGLNDWIRGGKMPKKYNI